MFDDKLINIKLFIEFFNKNTYFKNVHLFTNYIKNFVKFKKTNIVYNNVQLCYRN